MPFATRDEHGRLRVGAAIGATGDYLERAAELIQGGRRRSRHRHRPRPLGRHGTRAGEFRKRFGDVELIAGNVATAEGTRFLRRARRDGVKVGIGPGGGCTTRHDHQFRRPAAAGAGRMPAGGRRLGVPLIADGGIKRRRGPRRGAPLWRRHRDARERVRRHGGSTGRNCAQVCAVPESQKTVKVRSRCFAAWRRLARSRSSRRRGCRHGRARSDRRRRDGDQRARARLGAHDHPATC